MSPAIISMVFTPIILGLISISISQYIERKVVRLKETNFQDIVFKCPRWLYSLVIFPFLCAIAFLHFNLSVAGALFALMFIGAGVYGGYGMYSFSVAIQMGKVYYNNGKKGVVFPLNGINRVKIKAGTIEIDRNRKEKIRIPFFIKNLSLLVAMLRYYRP